MSQTKLQEAFGEIDERFIAEAHEPRAVRKRSVRILRRGLLAAAVLVALALSLLAYGSGRWYSIVGKKEMAADDWYRIRNTSIHYTDPAGWIELNDSKGGDIFGFRINDPTIPEEELRYRRDLKSCLEQKRLLSEATLTEAELEDVFYGWAWRRSDGEKLTVCMQDRTELGVQDFFSLYEFELVREGVINGMKVIWIRCEHPYLEHSYHLICHNQALGCFVTVSSDRGFENAEALAEKLVFVDSGVFVPRKSERTVCVLSCPEDLAVVSTVGMDRYYTGAVLEDRSLDPAELPMQLSVSENPLQHIHVRIAEPIRRIDDYLLYYPVVEQTTVNGRPAYLCMQEKRQICTLIILYEDLDCYVELDNETFNAMLKDEMVPGILKDVGARLKPIPVAIVEDPPINLLSTLAVG